jgi:hypothetical protein
MVMRISAALALVGAFGLGLAAADLAKERRYAMEVVDSTRLGEYTTDAMHVLLDHWVQQRVISGNERAAAKQSLLSLQTKNDIRARCIEALVEEFDEATLRQVAAFYKTEAGRTWAQSYENTMQGMTEKAGAALLKSIQRQRR